MNPYYQDDHVTLYHGDCLEHADLWTGADVLVTDPPYGIDFQIRRRKDRKDSESIAGDKDLAARDSALELWGNRPAIVFGSPLKPVPLNTRQVLVWEKTLDSGLFGAYLGFRRNWEAIYLIGPLPKGPASSSGIITSKSSTTHYAKSAGHTHAKPIPLMEQLIERCPSGVVADPFAGSGSTLVAAKNLGWRAIGIEIDERYCEIIAKRCAQEVLNLGAF